MGNEDLLREVRRGRKDHVAAFGFDIVHEFRKGPVILNIPEKIRKKNQERERAAEPDPLAGKDAALLGEQEPYHDGKSENANRVFFLQTDACDDAKPEPVAGI